MCNQLAVKDAESCQSNASKQRHFEKDIETPRGE